MKGNENILGIDKDTEYFNGLEWKSVAGYTQGDRVLQYEEGKGVLVNPVEYFHWENDDPFYLHTGNIGSCLTNNSNIVYLDKEKVFQGIKYSEVLNGFDGLIPVNCIYAGNGEEVSYKERKVLFFNIISHDIEDKSEYFKRAYNMGLENRLKMIRAFFLSKNLDKLLGTVYIEDNAVRNFLASLMRLSGLGCLRGAHTVTMLTSKSDYDGTFFKFTPLYAKYDLNYGKFTQVHDKDKYNFIVPSHMLVLRRKGHVFVTGDYIGI